MFQALVLLLILLIIIMIACVRAADKRLVRNRSGVIYLIWMAVVTAVYYTIFILIPPGYHMLATFMDGLYFLSTDWLVIFLILFTAEYTKVSPPSKWPRRMIYILAGVDSVSFVVNTFTHHMFDLQSVFANDWGTYYWSIDLNLPHLLHRFFVYAMVMYSLVVLGYSLVKAPVIYKSKYGIILFQTLAVVGLNVVCSIVDTKLDYSVILYASLALSIDYYVLYASPEKLLEKIHATIVEDSVVGQFSYDYDGRCISVNGMAKDLFAGSDTGKDVYTIAEEYLSAWMEKYKGNPEKIIGEEQTILKDGREIYIYVTYQNFLDEKGRELGFCFQFEDRTEVILQFKEEQHRARHDSLTGLLNRNAFEEEAKKLLSEAEEPYCMLCSDIQDFKLINELYGTDTGDRMLIEQANLIRRTQSPKAVSARIYADKFCTLLPVSEYDEKRFIESMSLAMDIGLNQNYKVHFYLGVYYITDVNEHVWTMRDKAILAIDTIRGSYEEHAAYYMDELLRHIIAEKEVLSEFENAMADGQFKMFLQPQIANNGNVVGAEALVRWIHPGKGMISPGLFIPTLEKAGLIHKLDLYMWENAAKKLEEWKKQGKENLSISVNISTKDFYYLDVSEAFRSLAGKYDFDIKKLKLEITESALMENVRDIMNTLDRLHVLGYDIEIDDFGSGYSSLGMLKDIKADILKIDMIFLQETKNIERSKTILKNIVSMSKELGMPVITEGVETKEQVDFLGKVGCDMFQGFYFAKPMNLESFEREYC